MGLATCREVTLRPGGVELIKTGFKDCREVVFGDERAPHRRRRGGFGLSGRDPRDHAEPGVRRGDPEDRRGGECE